MTLDERILGMRLRVMRRAHELGNVSAACGLHPRRRQARPGRPPRIALALTPTWGCGRLSSHLRRETQVTLALSSVQRILRRAGLGRRRDRLGLLEHHSAGTCGLLTERTRRQLARARSRGRLYMLTNLGNWCRSIRSTSAS